MTGTQKKQLETELWGIANLLRGKISADDYRDYILGFIFYKYLSEKQYLYANELLEGEEVTDYKKVADTGILKAIEEESILKLGYFLKPSDLFSEIAKKGNANLENEDNYILEDLQAILNNIEQSTMGTESEDDFNALFEDLDLNSTKIGRTVGARNEIIVQILNHLNKIDFELEEIDSDVLGDAYEYLIAKFAAGAGKSAGEFYTPQQVSKVLAKMVTTGKTKIRSAYDPTCGSGSLLLRIAKEVKVSEFYGQERNRTTYNLARMNMILHDVHFREFDIRQEDTLENPQHFEKRFEAVVANPPFSARWKGNKNPLNESDERFSQYGKLAPSSKADYAFVQHMIYQLADNGTMACVLPHGVLYRGYSEYQIRKYLVETKNYLDAVIGLPPNIFYGTDIETCILVFKKCRENLDNILFIDASNWFIKDDKKNTILEDHIEKIISIYRSRKVIDRVSYCASIDEIRKNDFYLNIYRYVKQIETEEKINLDNVSNELNKLEKKKAQIDCKIENYCRAFNIKSPFSELNFTNDSIKIKKLNITGSTSWKDKYLSEVLNEHKTKNNKLKYKEVFSVAKEKGVINQIEHLGRSYASDDLKKYKVVFPGDVVYTKSPTADFPYGIIKQNKTGRTGIVSSLYAVFKPINYNIGLFLDYYFSSWVNTINYLKPIINKGAKNTINLNNDVFLKGSKILLPDDEEELANIIDFLSLFDKKLNIIENENELYNKYKKAILQQTCY